MQSKEPFFVAIFSSPGTIIYFMPNKNKIIPYFFYISCCKLESNRFCIFDINLFFVF